MQGDSTAFQRVARAARLFLGPGGEMPLEGVGHTGDPIDVVERLGCWDVDRGQGRVFTDFAASRATVYTGL